MDYQIKKLEQLRTWKYTEAWLEKKYGRYLEDEGRNKDKLLKSVLNDSGSFAVRYYIYNSGPELIAHQRHINSFIDKINAGEFNNSKDYNSKIEFIDRLESLPVSSFLRDSQKELDKLVAYNYESLPKELLDLINNINRMRCEAKRVFDDLVTQLSREAEKVQEQEHFHERNEFLSGNELFNSKWDNIELKHSKVENGFVYVLTNALMPGLVKIGFTAGNPAIRADRLSEKHQLPSRFEVAGYFRTKDPFIVEKQVHSELNDLKVSGEFFQIQPGKALEVIQKYIVIP